jgi:hypothetical protein
MLRLHCLQMMPCLITMARTHSYQPSTRRLNARRMHAGTQRCTALPSRCRCSQSSTLLQLLVQCVAAEHTLVAVTARFVIVADSISSPLQSEQRAPAAGIRRAPTRRRYTLQSELDRSCSPQWRVATGAHYPQQPLLAPQLKQFAARVGLVTHRSHASLTAGGSQDRAAVLASSSLLSPLFGGP